MSPTLPDPPYIAVIFTSRLDPAAGDDYAESAARLEALVRDQPGFLGIESAREGRLGITVSYWKDDAAIAAWKRQADHRAAQETGKRAWYEEYSVRIAKVERAWAFSRQSPARAPRY